MSGDVLNWTCEKHGRIACVCWQMAIDAEIQKLRSEMPDERYLNLVGYLRLTIPAGEAIADLDSLLADAYAERDARIEVLPCNAADLHGDAHVWDFGTDDKFVCFGVDEPYIVPNASSGGNLIRSAIDEWAKVAPDDGERFTRAEVADWFFRYADMLDDRGGAL